MSQEYKFRAVIEDAGGGGAFVTIPFDVEQAFGKKRVKIRALIGGEPYRGTLVRMGGLCHLLPVLKEIREKTGKSFGDEIDIELEEDKEPRQVEIPQDMKNALVGNPKAQAFFEQLSYTHQKEYIQWIEEAKRQQTRQIRIARTVELLTQGKKEH
jgi:Bacteriocin-protection, YdeI or OmpD-Associated/Domain of unknown function (DUF1905)